MIFVPVTFDLLQEKKVKFSCFEVRSVAKQQKLLQSPTSFMVHNSLNNALFFFLTHFSPQNQERFCTLTKEISNNSASYLTFVFFFEADTMTLDLIWAYCNCVLATRTVFFNFTFWLKDLWRISFFKVVRCWTIPSRSGHHLNYKKRMK